MKQYRIFHHPGGMLEAVKQGWSWPAMFFTVLWAFTKRLWSLGGTALASFFVLALILESLLEPPTLDDFSRIVGLIVALLFGLRGNIWRENNLLARGFTHVDTLSAPHPDNALAQYLKKNAT